MIQEVYHSQFRDDIITLSKILDKQKFHECLYQIDSAIQQILLNPQKPAFLKYAPLLNYRKKKFFSTRKSAAKQRPNMRVLYHYDEKENIIYFLSVGMRIDSKPRNPNDVYQRIKQRNLRSWG